MEQSEQHGPAPGEQIPVPPDFPIVWENPDDEQLFWTQDAMHFPDPVTMLEADVFIRTLYRHGFTSAFEFYEIPIRAHPRRINTYHYVAMVPLTASPEEMEATGKRSQERLETVMYQLSDLWGEEFLPEIKQYLEYWDGFDLHGASIAELLSHLDETTNRLVRLWEIHFRVVLPMGLAPSMLEEFYKDLFGTEDTFEAYRLLQGFNNKTVESGQMLWQLSRKALDMLEVRKILEEKSAAEVPVALEESAEGREFLAELRAYLDEYGHLGDKWGLSYPTWVEDPTPVIKMLKDYVTQPAGGPGEKLIELANERERLLAETYQRLRGYPQAVRDQFGSLLKAAQDSTVLSEDHGFWIDFYAMARVRRVFLEFGRRFTEAGVLEQPDDVFHLTLDELRETAEKLPDLDRRGLVAKRKAEIEHFRTVQPPPALGALPPGPPPDNPMSRSMMKFFGTPPQPPREPGVLVGSPGSPGVVRGPARVLRSLSEAAEIQQGEVLVAETTAPPWTPLFATAAAVVTDTGGILSHCAVVAREYRIPAVVGAAMATATISDGQTVEVDGDKGIVRMLSENGS
jgi:phosphohistidine swiveling domain-containing protein